MKHLFIINSKAGRGQGRDLIPAIEKAFIDNREDFRILVSERPGHSEELARKFTAVEKSRVYAVGGDGTVNEVLNGMANSGSSLGIIPVGSGNDFFRSIGQNMSIQDLLKKTIQGSAKPVDIARVNNRYFINISSVGLDAEAAWYSERLRKTSFLGVTSYILGAVEAIFKSRAQAVELWIDDQLIVGQILLAAMANGRYYGGGMIPAPEAKIDDGYLDVCVIKPMKKIRMLILFPKYMRGNHGNMPEVSFYKAKKVILRSANDIALNADGEVSWVKEAVFEIMPRGINLVFP